MKKKNKIQKNSFLLLFDRLDCVWFSSLFCFNQFCFFISFFSSFLHCTFIFIINTFLRYLYTFLFVKHSRYSINFSYEFLNICKIFSLTINSKTNDSCKDNTKISTIVFFLVFCSTELFFAFAGVLQTKKQGCIKWEINLK